MQVLNWVLIIAGALMILGEVALGGFAGFDLVLIGSTFVIGGGVGLLMHSATTGLAVAAVLCVLYVAAGRRYVRRRMNTTSVRTNTDALIGREGVVMLRIAPHEPGQVKVNDEVWRAATAPGVAQPLEAGQRVTVAGIDGVTLHVR
jgi:membrane protein implicated in regulation of membrane protease activity